jgi:hypothetical protein
MYNMQNLEFLSHFFIQARPGKPAVTCAGRAAVKACQA